MRKIVIDSFFHAMPGHRLSRDIAVGGYITNVGRYSPYDVYHPNGMSMLISDLTADYDVTYSNQPFSEMSLCGADILVVPNPDYPLYEGASAYRLDSDDMDAMIGFMNRGGSVLLMINSFLSRSDFWEENFDSERVGALLRRLGVEWDPDFMSDDSRILPAKSGSFTVGYGQGGRVKGKLPENAQELLTWEGMTFGFIENVGRGKLAVVGDAGLVSNGLYGFPGFDNRAFISDLFGRLTPAFAEIPGRFEKYAYHCLSCATHDGGIGEELFRSLRPGAKFEVDHHYRHLVWDEAAQTVAPREIGLPFDYRALEGKRKIGVSVPFVALGEGRTPGTLEMTLNVSAAGRGDETEYFVSGTEFSLNASWKDIGLDEEVFGKIGKLERVNTVVQYMLAVRDGKLRWATCKQGQIFYDRNVKNPSYGYDIMLGSRGTAYSPAAE